jgi:hypothetical protein
VAKGRSPVFSRCCLRGKVSLPQFNEWPSPLKELFSFTCGPASTHFYRLIRHYNSLFAFTSMGADIDKTINSGGAPYVFKMSGSVFHRMGSLLPRADESLKFAQLYMISCRGGLIYLVRRTLLEKLGVLRQLIHLLLESLLTCLISITIWLSSSGLRGEGCILLALLILLSDFLVMRADPMGHVFLVRRPVRSLLSLLVT